jgi:hypothetical protein
MQLRSRQSAARGVLLIDAMVYIVVLGIILVLAASVFDKGMRESTGLQRNVADIERALKAGERWRADVRAAIGRIEAGDQTLTIPQREGEVVYEFATNEVRRTVNANKTEVFLARVQNSAMTEERRGDVVGWKWEVELERRLKEARVRPLFTFMAVPKGAQ